MKKQNEEESIEVSILLVGARQHAFSLTMHPSDSLLELLETIRSRNLTYFAGVDYSLVRPYLAKHEDGTWISKDGPEVRVLMDGHGPEVDAICRTQPYFLDLLGELFTSLGSGNVHLLLRVVPRPRVLGKRSHPLQASSEEASFEVLWCRLVGDSTTSSFPVVIDMTKYVYHLQVLIQKAAFQDEPEVEDTRIFLFEAKDGDGKWPTRSASEPSKLEKIQNSTLREISQKALHPMLKLREVFQSLDQDDLNVWVMTAPKLVVRPGLEYKDLTQHYRDVAEMLNISSEVDQLVKDIERATSTGASSPYLTPFIVLTNSSGTGKTQMAFNLMARTGVQVFYIPCGEDHGEVYQAFSQRSESFLKCVEQDLPNVLDARIFTILPQMQLQTFGFIWALLSGRSFFIEPKRPQDVKEKLKTLTTGGKKIVIFLDEFPRLDKSRARTSEVALRFMLNVFRSFGLAVVLSATNAAARDLARMDFGRRMGQSGKLWCTIRPSLPSFQDRALESLPPPLQELLRNSRPSFAQFALKYATENALGHDVVEFLDGMTDALATTFADRRAFASEAFRVGQLGLFLATSYAVENATQNEIQQEDTSQLISGHFARLRETKSIELILSCETYPFTIRREAFEPWKCLSQLPTPNEDCLLHLCLSGGKRFAALRDSSSSPIPFVRAFLEAEKADCSVLNRLRSDQAAYECIRMEMLVAGAIAVSSHGNGFSGVPISSFLSTLLFELDIQSSPEFQLKFPPNLTDALSSLRIPFLAPSGLAWPEYLAPTALSLGAMKLERSYDRTLMTVLDCRMSVECITHQTQLTSDVVKSLLERVPSASIVHLVVMRSLEGLCYRKQDQSRKKRMESILASLEAFHHANFYRVLSSAGCAKTHGSKVEVRAELVSIRYMKNQCRAAVCPERPSCKVDRLVLFLEFTGKIEA